MIFRLMQELDVYPPAAVVKIGLSSLSVEEAANAGCRSIMVSGEQAKTLADVPGVVEALDADRKKP
jgi:phosphonoacetaldehyde hydrolase